MTLKSVLIRTCLIPSLFALSASAFADGNSGAAPAAPKGAQNPCKKLDEACKAAGYKVGAAKEGKGLFMNCMKPLLDGKTVEGVSASPDDIKACQAVKANFKERKGHHRPGQGQTGGNPGGAAQGSGAGSSE